MRYCTGAELVRVHADDPDQGPSGQVTYAFTDHVQRVYGELFRVDADTGAIYLKTVLDYEKSANYYLTVTATDLGTPPSLPVTAKVPYHCFTSCSCPSTYLYILFFSRSDG